jgi:alpha-ketoglutarate-dependent 2,4-dichlorophenoxyacetate dioxygenase
MEIHIKHKEQEFFAVIKDIDIKNLSNEDFLKIKDIVETYGVVVLKNQIINDDDQILFSKKFGKLEKALEHDTLEGIRPEITRISNIGINNEILPIDSKKVIYDRGNRSWHTDSSYKDIPSKISILSAREIPFDGGGTEYIDARHALETWNKNSRKYDIKELKNEICEHSIVYSRMINTGDIFDNNYKNKMPFVKQRLIRTHPMTKRSAFYAGSHCSHIIGWDLEQSRSLIKEINEWIVEAGAIVHHKWSNNEIVMWDNRRVLHRGTYFDETSARRIMHRTTVAGDYPSYKEEINL